MREPEYGSRGHTAGDSAQTFVRATLEVARKEVMQHIRTKRLFIMCAIILFLLFMVTVVFGQGIARTFGDGFGVGGTNAKENLVLAFYFGIAIFGGLQFTQMFAIVLTADAVCSEWSNRTIFLLLSKPVSRAAFVTGKFLGNVATIALAIFAMFTLDYLIIQAMFSGSPDGEEVAGFFLTLGMIVLGSATFASISLFFSTLTRSTVMSFLLMIAMWLVVFPLVGMIGFFSNLEDIDQEGEDYFDSPKVQNWLYFNPASNMQAGIKYLVPHDDGDIKDSLRFLNIFGIAPTNVALAAASLVAYTALFFMLSLWMVQRRNFE